MRLQSALRSDDWPSLPAAAWDVAASYSSAFREFLPPYDAVRQAAAPDTLLLEFLQSTYEAAADLGRWDRAALERT